MGEDAAPVTGFFLRADRASPNLGNARGLHGLLRPIQEFGHGDFVSRVKARAVAEGSDAVTLVTLPRIIGNREKLGEVLPFFFGCLVDATRRSSSLSPRWHVDFLR